jgi:spore coat protein H
MRRWWAVSVLVLAAAAVTACAPVMEPSDALFDHGKLHTVEITVEDVYLNLLATDLDNRVPCDVRYDGETIRGAGVRQKGNQAFALDDRPSFSVRFDEFDDGKDLYGLNKILLNSSKQDPTLYRARMASRVFKLAGIPAARVAHAKVSLNGEELGLYVVVEAIDKDFLRSHFGGDNDEGNLYEGPCCDDFVTDFGNLELDDEKKDGRTRDDIAALADVVLNTPGPELEAALEARLDLGSFLRSHALEALIDHWDGYSYRTNNYYLYNNPADGRFVFLPHGMDRVLADPSFDPEQIPLGRLSRRIREVPSLDERLHQELARLVPLAWDAAAIPEDIERAGEVIRSAGTDGEVGEDVRDFEKNKGELRDAVTLRRSLVGPEIVCGDGQRQGLEACDDGNTAGGDGCGPRCRVEP